MKDPITLKWKRTAAKKKANERQSARCRHCGYAHVDHGNNDRCPLVLADGVRVGFSNLYRYTPKK